VVVASEWEPSLIVLEATILSLVAPEPSPVEVDDVDEVGSKLDVINDDSVVTDLSIMLVELVS